MLRADGRSLALSLRNIYETFAISLPTAIEAVRGRLTTEVCNDRLRNWSRAVLAHARVELEVIGQQHIKPGQLYLVMSNHQSLYDIPVLFQTIGPNLRMVAKRELFHIPVFGKALASAGFIELDRSDRNAAIRSLERAATLLAQGTHVWIAPEGTRSRSGKLLPFKKGGFYLALQADLPILPVTLAGTRDALPAKGLLSRPGKSARVTIHAPIDPRPYRAMGKEGRQALMDDVRHSIESAL